MQGLFGGILSGGLVSVMALAVASVISETPPGVTPPAPPLVDAPVVEPAPTADNTAANDAGPSTPVGSLTIQEPVAPALPEGEQSTPEPASPPAVQTESTAPRADTDPLDEPEVVAIEGAMTAPEAPDTSQVAAQPLDPVLPNPQAAAPQTPVNETNLTVSTAPATPVIVAEPEVEVTTDEPAPEGEGEEVFVIDLGTDADPATPDAGAADDSAPVAEDIAVGDDGATEGVSSADQETTTDVATAEDATTADETPEPAPENDAAPDETTADVATVEDPIEGAPADEGEDLALATPTAPRLQLQGGENTLLTDRDTGVTIRRPGATDDAVQDAAPAVNALVDFAADAPVTDGKPLMSVVLIDDGSMSAAAAALSGLPFPVTIALDPDLENAAALLDGYRAGGFEVAVMAKLPEGALPTDVEVTFESVFRTLPETIAVLDIGDGGLQEDRAVTEQAMDILASQGRGFVTASQGLNMAGRAAEQAGVPAAVVYRDLDADDQDARVVRRFVDQAAFRARQESGVVLVGRVRPDTISALILWGTANNDDQVALVPLSAVLTAEE